MLPIGQAVGGEGIAHQHQLIAGELLQQHRHGGVHVHAVGNQAEGDPSSPAGFRHRSGGAVVQARHGIEGMGEHAYPRFKGLAGLFGSGGAVAEGHGDAQLPQALDHRCGALQLRGQGDQGDVVLEAADAGVEGLHAGNAECSRGWAPRRASARNGPSRWAPSRRQRRGCS